jgi:SAM-dependent methyltransferase/REP element-mobilizing transposase RayT
MARKLRLEFPGAIYHVINRGNYRSWIFDSPGAKGAFEDCLFAACDRAGWRLHAFVIMGNHYHLALETPRANLAAGMHWLQSAFATRFNRYRDERGHVYQGRYKSLLVEAGEPLAMVCDYIHLNPVRAAPVSVGRLARYRHSSYSYLQNPALRPKCLRPATALSARGLTDTAAGRRSYDAYLTWSAAEGPAGKSESYVSLSKGWALGSAGFKQALVADHALAASMRAWEQGDAREVRELAWTGSLARLLCGIPPTERADHRQSAPWKIRVAVRLKATTDASNGWLGAQLHMGSRLRQQTHQPRAPSGCRVRPDPFHDLRPLSRPRLRPLSRPACIEEGGGFLRRMSHRDSDKIFAGTIPQLYESHMVPLIFEPYAADLAERLAARAPRRVLELAAGTGVVTRALASALPPGVAIVATDLNPAMLEQARVRGTVRPVEWRLADAMQLPFADDTFDAVVCQFGVMFFPDKARAFAEVRRVLRPGGVFLFNTWDRLEDNEIAALVTAALASVFPQVPPRFMARTPHGYHDRTVLARDLASGGFTAPPAIETRAMRARAASAHIVAVAYCQGTPLRGEIDALDPTRLGEATDAAAQAIAQRFGSGPVDSRIQAHIVVVEK